MVGVKEYNGVIPSYLEDLKDVTEDVPQDGDRLVWDQNLGKWRPGHAVDTTSLTIEQDARLAADEAEQDARIAADNAEIAARTAADLLLIPLTQKGAIGGVATLGSDGVIPSNQIGPISTVSFLGEVASDSAMTALSQAVAGSQVIRTDFTPQRIYMLLRTPASNLANWSRVTFGDVQSVEGQTGVVVLPHDPGVGVPGLRTLGPGASQAAPGNDARFSDARTPTGAAGGVLGGTFPNPTFAEDMATQAELDGAISTLAAADTANLAIATGRAIAFALVLGG